MLVYTLLVFPAVKWESQVTLRVGILAQVGLLEIGESGESVTAKAENFSPPSFLFISSLGLPGPEPAASGRWPAPHHVL